MGETIYAPMEEKDWERVPGTPKLSDLDLEGAIQEIQRLRRWLYRAAETIFSEWGNEHPAEVIYEYASQEEVEAVWERRRAGKNTDGITCSTANG